MPYLPFRKHLRTALLAACAGGFLASTTTHAAPVDLYKPQTEDGYVIANSAFGRQNLTRADFDNTIDQLDGRHRNEAVRFVWDWPDNGTFRGIRAFNYAGIGLNDTQTRSDGTRPFTNNLLPTKLGGIRDRTRVNYKVSFTGFPTGSWNVSLNMRAMVGANATKVTDERAELHIYKNYSGNPPASNRLGDLRVNGSNYVMRQSRNSRGQPYYQAWRINKRSDGIIDLRPFINDWATSPDFDNPIVRSRFPAGNQPQKLDRRWYLGYIRLGAEVSHGTGDMTIDYMKNTIESYN